MIPQEPARHPWKISQENSYAVNILVVVCPIAVTLNAVLLYRFYVNRRQLKNGYLILLSICMGDFLCSCCIGFSSALHVLLPELSWEWCQSIGIVSIATASASGMSAVFMSAERYMQIALSTTLTKTQVMITTSSIWIFFVIFACIPIFTETYYEERPCQVWCLPAFTKNSGKHLPFMVMTLVLQWIALIAVPFCYWSIYKFALSNGFKWGLQSGIVTAAVGPSVMTYSEDSTRHDCTSEIIKTSVSTQNKFEVSSTEKNAMRSQLMLTKKLALLVVQFYIGWFALAICLIYESVRNSRLSSTQDFILGLSNALSWVLNPLILLSLDTQLRLRIRVPRKIVSISCLLPQMSS
ncbi:hypothetical protein BKA69DRAFT_1126996 [Paraphysoderma sedebokerense]|nr:hypothetical protein BKA69DRAFT_1126996 [Paraphysoderma sedebokerense]